MKIKEVILSNIWQWNDLINGIGNWRYFIKKKIKKGRIEKQKVNKSYLTAHQEFFLPGSDGSRWIRSTDPVDYMSLSLSQIWFTLINFSYFDYFVCSNYSVCSDLFDHLKLY